MLDLVTTFEAVTGTNAKEQSGSEQSYVLVRYEHALNLRVES